MRPSGKARRPAAAVDPLHGLTDHDAERVLVACLLRAGRPLADRLLATGFQRTALTHGLWQGLYDVCMYVAMGGDNMPDGVWREACVRSPRRDHAIDGAVPKFGPRGLPALIFDLWFEEPVVRSDQWRKVIDLYADDFGRDPYDSRLFGGSAAAHYLTHLDARRRTYFAGLAAVGEALNPTGDADHFGRITELLDGEDL